MRYYGKIRSKLPNFLVKSKKKIYTGQKKFTWIYSWGSWQIWGMRWDAASVSNNWFYLQVLISHLMFFVHRVSKNKNVTIHCDLFISLLYKVPAKNFFLQILTQVPGPRDIRYETSVCECFDWDVVNFLRIQMFQLK